MIHDYCVIGGGIVGLATAMSILQRRPGADLVVLEKEDGLARHQTGHNSGVIHSGIYYQPGSLKAELCRRGAQATKDFCRDHGIPVTVQGKLLVATDERDAERMTGLEERARDNRIDVVRLSSAELRDLEPHVRGVGALLVPATGSVDYTLVCRAMADVVRSSGGQVELGVEVTGLDESAAAVAVGGRDRQSADRQWTARQVVVCAGLQADRLARMAGATSDARIIPFRGEYYRLPDRKSAIVQHLIYPIPDPDLPFLGVHLTPMVDGRVTVGPNAVLGLSREGYRKLSVSARDVADFLSFPGFWNLARRNVRTGAVEVR
ncbi:MAG TPA: L-2-hydroxyglutarate oxidase, partial [Nakamurella sp.]